MVHHKRELVDYPELALDEKNLISMAWHCHEKTKTRGKKEEPQGVRIIKA